MRIAHLAKIRSLKVISRTFLAGVVGLALLAVTYVKTRSRTGDATRPKITSLAVLPLKNLSGDPTQEYLSDGITEDLITRLARMHALRVISRTSVMQYRDTKKSVPEIGRELNVNAVIEGSVLRSGNRVRITAQLIRADTDAHLWAESYDRELSDVLTLQNEVARTIADEVRAELTPQEQERLAAGGPVNSEAYELYLRGRYYWNRRDIASTKTALEYFQQAIAKDPNYALAYAGLGDAYQFLIDIPREEVFAKSMAAYKKAAELDSGLAEPHAGLGLLLVSSTYEWTSAEREFRRAIELNSGYASAHQWYSNLLALRGRKEEAKAEIQKALQLDPLSPIINTSLGYRLAEDERYDDAIRQYRKVLETNPNFWTAYQSLADAYLQKGMFREAIEESRTAEVLQGFRADKVNRETKAFSEAYEKSGPRGYWEKRLELAMVDFKRAQPAEGSRYEIASYFAILGKKEQAIEWLGRSYTAREPDLAKMKIAPQFKDLRSDPRVQDLVYRVGLPP